MSFYDYIVIGVYLVFMLSLGPIYKSFSKTASDYFRGGGTMLWWVVGSSAFMTSFSAWSFTGGAAKAYETGTFFLVLFACNFVATLVCLILTAHRFRQMRVITAIEAIHNRFGTSSEQIFTWLPIFFNMLFGGIMLYTISVFMAGAFGTDMTIIILSLGVVMIVMTLVGGSWAATAGDFVQMLVVLMITIMMAVLTLKHEKIGGLSGLVEKMPSYHMNWTELSRPGIIAFFIVTLLINQVISTNSMLSGAGRYLFVKDGNDSRKAVMISLLGFLFLSPIWMVPALGAAVIFPDLTGMYSQLNNPNEAAYVAIAKELLPQGLLGLLVCGIFAASLTSMNSGLNTYSGIFVRNFYIKIVNPKASESRQIFIGRLFILFYGLIWIFIALLLKDVKSLKLFDLILLAAASIGLPSSLPMAYGMFIRKTPSWAGWSTMLIGFAVSMAAYFTLKDNFLQANWGQVTELNGQELADLRLAITTGLIFVICSLWFFGSMLFYNRASEEYREEVKEFFHTMNTPITTNESIVNDYGDDTRQYSVLGKLCIAYGVLTTALVSIPNPAKDRILIVICGGIIFLIGYTLHLVSKIRKKAETDG